MVTEAKAVPATPSPSSTATIIVHRNCHGRLPDHFPTPGSTTQHRTLMMNACTTKMPTYSPMVGHGSAARSSNMTIMDTAVTIAVNAASLMRRVIQPRTIIHLIGRLLAGVASDAGGLLRRQRLLRLHPLARALGIRSAVQFRQDHRI